MPTTPFGPILEELLKGDLHGVRLQSTSGEIVHPQFFCCISGLDPVLKDPVAVAKPQSVTLCWGDAAIVDISASYSPSFTLVSYEVDWGDGNVDAGAWPPAGDVVQTIPYSLPGVYTVTVTVTDNQPVPGVGMTEFQIEVFDCEEFIRTVFCATELGSAYRSDDGCMNWQRILDGGLYDLKVSWFTRYTYVGDGQRLWAATDYGLLKSVDGGHSWSVVTLPEPSPGIEPVVYALCMSTVAPLEVFALASVPDRVWLYHTLIDGDYWEFVELSSGAPPPVLELTVPGTCIETVHGHKFTVLGGKLHCTGLYRRDVAGWTFLGDGSADSCHGGVCRSGSNICMVGVRSAPYWDLFRVLFWDGASWTVATGYNFGRIDCVFFNDQTVTAQDDTVYRLTWYTGTTYEHESVIRYDSLCNYHSEWAMHRPVGLEVHGSDLFVMLERMAERGRILRYTGPATCYGMDYDSWVEEWNDGGANLGMRKFFEHAGVLFAVSDWSSQLLMRDDGTQAWSLHASVCPDIITCGYSCGGQLYVGAANNIYRLTGGGYVLFTSVPVGSEIVEITVFGGRWYAYCYNGNVYNLDTGGVMTDLYIPSDGRAHLMAMDVTGLNVYCVLLDAGNNPVVFRVSRDLSVVDNILTTGNGTWGGVACDLNIPERLWVYGDFGAEKVLVSDDFGDTLVDITDVSWAPDEVVRPLLISIYDPNDAVAVLNTALEVWRTRDVWLKTGDISLAAQCGDRDIEDDEWMLIGVVPSIPIPYGLLTTLDFGQTFYERNNGMTMPDTVVSVQIA